MNRTLGEWFFDKQWDEKEKRFRLFICVAPTPYQKDKIRLAEILTGLDGDGFLMAMARELLDKLNSSLALLERFENSEELSNKDLKTIVSCINVMGKAEGGL